eukprot:1181176-Prorocentrum_minimum.AAC.1
MEGISPSVLPTPMYNSASSQPSSSLNRLSKYLRTSSSYLRFWHSDKSQSSVELISRIGICALIVTFTHEGTKTSKLVASYLEDPRILKITTISGLLPLFCPTVAAPLFALMMELMKTLSTVWSCLIMQLLSLILRRLTRAPPQYVCNVTDYIFSALFVLTERGQYGAPCTPIFFEKILAFLLGLPSNWPKSFLLYSLDNLFSAKKGKADADREERVAVCGPPSQTIHLVRVLKLVRLLAKVVSSGTVCAQIVNGKALELGGSDAEMLKP